MRTIDTDNLEALGHDGAGPWRMGDGRLLRIASGAHPIRTEEEAREVLAAYRAAAASAGTPQAHEVVRVSGGYGVVADYVAGLGMQVHLAFGSYAPEEAGRAMGALLRGLHGAGMEAGRDWNGVFRGWAGQLAPLLPGELGARLSSLVDAVPERRCLLHGDFHMGNVVVSGGTPVPIDMEAAGFGHPVFDLAVARSRMLGNAKHEAREFGIDAQTAERFARGTWRGLLEGYFEGSSGIELAEADRRIEALSEVEACCFRYGVGRAEPGGRQRARVALCAKRLAELLPRTGRLDF